MPQMSTSTPLVPFLNNNTNNFQTLGSINMMQQQPNNANALQQSNMMTQSTPAMNSHNPFALSTTMPPSTIMVASPTSNVNSTNNNPFNNTAPKHQQLQPWGSSLF
jgi:hypothetical protein